MKLSTEILITLVLCFPDVKKKKNLFKIDFTSIKGFLTLVFKTNGVTEVT